MRTRSAPEDGGGVRWDVEAIRSRLISTRDLPTSARMLVLSPDAAALIAIRRTKPGHSPYYVLPGGGLEDEDHDPLSGALRELEEETGLRRHDIEMLSAQVIVEDDQWIHLARARHRLDLHLGGPESELDADAHGTYEPIWLEAADPETAGLFPLWLRDIPPRGSGRR
ncbi:NUDIX domain-containing protein [Brachybacterium endophyticum]|nr:NUDIX domain-containing protein [Brachybacterium endophyticum]